MAKLKEMRDGEKCVVVLERNFFERLYMRVEEHIDDFICAIEEKYPIIENLEDAIENLSDKVSDCIIDTRNNITDYLKDIRYGKIDFHK